MARKASLTAEQVFMVRNDVLEVPLKKYAEVFKVSPLTLHKAKKGLKPYDFEFKKEFEDEMVKKYFDRRELGL